MSMIIEAKEIQKEFKVRRGFGDIIFRKHPVVKALRGVTVRIPKKKIIGLIGESGSGKTTLGRIIAGLESPSGGELLFNGVPFNRKVHNGKVQVIFQDPWSAVNPMFTIFEIIEEPLLLAKNKTLLDLEPKERRELVWETLKIVGLQPSDELMKRHPSELSGGQLQRVAFARAAITKPELIIADEPVSMLDVSLRTGILNLILEFKEKFETSFLYITHDLTQALYITDYLYVLYLGEMMEQGPTKDVISGPLNPYTLSLKRSVIGMDSKDIVPLNGEIPSPADLPTGCGFHSRCPIAVESCSINHPELKVRETGEFPRKSRCILQ